MATVFNVFGVIILCKILPSLGITLYSSCNSLADGLYYIKPLENKKVIPVVCSKGYTMIDPSLNFESITSYLSSYDYSRRSSNIFSSKLNDFVNWREWWLASNDNTLFTVSPECNECLLPSTNNAYYESNYYFCFKTLANKKCDLNDTQLRIYCNQCDDAQHDNSNWSNCYGIAMSADHLIETDHHKCVSHTIMARPAMVKDRTFCTCYKPSNAMQYEYEYQVTTDDLPLVYLSMDIRNTLPFIDENIIFHNTDNNNNHNDNNIYYLTNNDFLYGTYRIRTPGEYILSEDIYINFNAPTRTEMNDINWSPNNYDVDNLYWWPSVQQQDEINGEYQGMYSYHGLYTLGFFAAITIQCNDVAINLNGYSMSMTQEFYVQQRFFSLIELSDRNFIAAQGPANLDQLDNEFYAANVVIKNGILGRSSHHGIHGNNNKNVIIKDMTISHFDVAGIGLNGANEVEIINCIVGPSNDNIPVLGRYTHGRAILPRLKQFVNDFGDERIRFYGTGRETIRISELADRLIKQMDMAYNYVINGVEPLEDDTDYADWVDAKQLFVNENGYMDAGSSYGIVLNGEGAATLAIGARTENTQNIQLSNVEIMGIYNGAIEKVKSVSNSDGDAIRGILSDVVDWFHVLDEDNKYIGDAYTDIIFAMNQIEKQTEWYFLHCMRITDDIMDFVLNGNGEIRNLIHFLCNTDIQMHSVKGAIGLRIDGVRNINLTEIYIHDIVNYGDLGSDICGEYEVSSISMEDSDIQYGYTGNSAHGLIVDFASGEFEDIVIENIDSHYGSSYAISIYKECDIHLRGDIKLNNIYSGSQLTFNDVENIKLPNFRPKACSVEARLDANVVYVNDKIIGDTIIGYDLCGDDEQIGQCNNCYVWNDDNVDMYNTNPSIWLIAVSFVAILGLIGYVTINKNNYLRILKCIRVSEETTPLLTI